MLEDKHIPKVDCTEFMKIQTCDSILLQLYYFKETVYTLEINLFNASVKPGSKYISSFYFLIM